MMLMAGMGVLAAAIPAPNAQAEPLDPVHRPSRPTHRRCTAPPPDAPPAPPPAATATLLFQDEFDGPLGAAPDPAKWTVQNWQDDVWPPVMGQYRDDRRNVFLDGNSNLVLLATQEDRPVLQRQTARQLERPDQHHLGSADQARLPVPRLLARVLGGQRGSAARRRGRHLRVVRQRGLASGNHGPRGIQREDMGRQINPRIGRRCVAYLANALGRETVSSSGGITLTERSRISACRRSPYPSTADPAICGGRSAFPAIGSIPCSPWRSVGPAAATPPWVPFRRQCSSTGFASGRRFGVIAPP